MKLEREKTINLYYKVLAKDPKKARDLIKKLDYKKDHYLLYCVANTYWEEDRQHKNKLRLTERYLLKAGVITQGCPFVLWLLGLVRREYGQYDLAKFCFEEIIRIGVNGIIKHGCTDDVNVAKAQVNDSKFQLYRLLKTSNPSLAKKYLSQFKNGLKQGIFTVIKSNRLIKENVKLDDISPSQLQYIERG